MSIEFELFDQAKRRARRRVFFWGMILVLSVLTGLFLATTVLDLNKGNPHIARVKVIGQIYDGNGFTDLISRLKLNENVKAVIIHINSPGGSVVGAEAIYVSLLKLSQIKVNIELIQIYRKLILVLA